MTVILFCLKSIIIEKKMNYTKWEIWLAEVMFEETSEVKKRPVLVIDDTDFYYVEVARITSHISRKWDWFDYEIKEWEKAGLKKPSTIRLDRIISMSNNRLIHKIGELQQEDRWRVQIILNRRG